MWKLCLAQDVEALTKLNAGEGLTESQMQLIDTLIIPGVTEVFAAYCGYPPYDSEPSNFDKKARTIYLSPENCRASLFLPFIPIATSPAIQMWEDGNVPRAYGAETLLVEGQDYFLDELRGIASKESGNFLTGKKVIKITLTGGYLTADATGVPPLLKMLAAQQCKIIFDRREEFGLSSRSLEGGNISINRTMLPKEITDQLDQNYRVGPR